MSLYNTLDIDLIEHLYETINMTEANWLLGNSVKFYPCENYSRDIESDWYPEYKDPVDINILFEDSPKSTLDHLNWLAEDEELPYLAYISSINYDSYKKFKSNCREQNLNIKEELSKCFESDRVTPTPYNSFYINVDKYSKVKIPYRMKESGEQDFAIVDIKGSSINPFIWICKLAPVRELFDKTMTRTINEKESKSTDEDLVGNSMLKVKDWN